MRCFICNNKIERVGMVVKGEITNQVCRRCSKILEEAMKVVTVKKEIKISDSSLSYLQSDEVSQAFCGHCELNIYEPYRKDPVTGIEIQPYQSCPANFDLGSDLCGKKKQFSELIEALAEADEMAGLRREVKIIL